MEDELETKKAEKDALDNTQDDDEPNDNRNWQNNDFNDDDEE